MLHAHTCLRSLAISLSFSFSVPSIWDTRLAMLANSSASVYAASSAWACSRVWVVCVCVKNACESPALHWCMLHCGTAVLRARSRLCQGLQWPAHNAQKCACPCCAVAGCARQPNMGARRRLGLQQGSSGVEGKQALWGQNF